MKKSLVLFLIISFFLVQCSATSAKRSFGEVVDDNVIMVKLRTKLLNDKVIKSNSIKLKVWKGVVTMKGVLEKQKQINRAIEIAEQQRGVKEVRAYLVIDSQYVAGTKKKKRVWSFLSKKKKTKHQSSDKSDTLIETDLPPDSNKTPIILNSKDPKPKKNVDKTARNNQKDTDFKEFEY